MTAVPLWVLIFLVVVLAADAVALLYLLRLRRRRRREAALPVSAPTKVYINGGPGETSGFTYGAGGEVK